MSESIVDVIGRRFTSANQIPVERAHITIHEWVDLKYRIFAAEEENERVRQANLDVMAHFEDMKACKEKAEARVAELESTLENYEALKRMHRLENYPNELAARGWLLLKQADAVEAATKATEIKSATDDSKCYSPALHDYAQRLRTQANELEAGGEK